MNRSLKIAWGTLLVSLVVVAMKAGAYLATGSVALYSDALETVINVVAALLALVAIWVSSQPADDNHPYGHHKAEYLSAVVEATLVLMTALLIGREAWMGWESPRSPSAPAFGLALNAGAGALNLGWAFVLTRCGRRWKSPALAASGRHLLTDVWTSGGVLLGFALIPLTGWLRLDPLIAGAVALNILWAGFGILRSSVAGLMDEAVEPEAVALIRTIIGDNAAGAIEAHDIRSRCAGQITFVDFHLVVPARMAVEDAHMICDGIEDALRAAIGEVTTSIHVEPEGKAKHHGVLISSRGTPL